MTTPAIKTEEELKAEWFQVWAAFTNHQRTSEEVYEFFQSQMASYKEALVGQIDQAIVKSLSDYDYKTHSALESVKSLINNSTIR